MKAILHFLRKNKMTLIYVMFSLTWIYFTDNLAFAHKYLFSDFVLKIIQIAKGSAFVLGSSALIFFLGTRICEQQARLKEVMKLGLMGTFEHDTASDVVKLSEGTMRIFEFKEPKVHFSQILEMVVPEDTGIVRKVGKEDQTINFVYRANISSNRLKYIRVNGVSVKKNNRIVVKGIVQDITENKQLESRLNQTDIENFRLSAILKTVKNLIIITDINRRVVWINKAFTEKTGYSQKEVVNAPTAFLYGPRTNSSALKKIEEALACHGYFSVEMEVYKKDGSAFWVKADGSPVKDQSGAPVGYITVAEDIEVRRKREEELQRHNVFLKEITFMASHEIRRPLASIMALLNILNDTEDEQLKQECMQMLNSSAEDLDCIIRKVHQKVFNMERNQLAGNGNGSITASM